MPGSPRRRYAVGPRRPNCFQPAPTRRDRRNNFLRRITEGQKPSRPTTRSADPRRVRPKRRQVQRPVAMRLPTRDPQAGTPDLGPRHDQPLSAAKTSGSGKACLWQSPPRLAALLADLPCGCPETGRILPSVVIGADDGAAATVALPAAAVGSKTKVPLAPSPGFRPLEGRWRRPPVVCPWKP